MATTNPNHIFWQDIAGVYDPTTQSYVYGDQTGNTRGTPSLDIQAKRSAVTKVASGVYSIAVGISCLASGKYALAVGNAATASGDYTAAIGGTSTASGKYSLAVGLLNTASGIDSFVIGNNSTATATSSTAIGSYAAARITKTTNIVGPIINRKDNSEGASVNFERFCGVRVVLETTIIDLKTTVSETITIPTGAHFFPDEVGVHITTATTVTGQPSIRFGNTGNHAALLAITATTGLTAAFMRNRFSTLVTGDGQTTLVAEVTTGATATTLKGRFYFTGLLIED